MYKYYLIKRSCFEEGIVSVYGFNSLEKLKSEISFTLNNSFFYVEIVTNAMILNINKFNGANEFAKKLKIL